MFLNLLSLLFTPSISRITCLSVPNQLSIYDCFESFWRSAMSRRMELKLSSQSLHSDMMFTSTVVDGSFFFGSLIVVPSQKILKISDPGNTTWLSGKYRLEFGPKTIFLSLKGLYLFFIPSRSISYKYLWNVSVTLLNVWMVSFFV